VLRAIAAFRFRVKGALDPHDDGVAQEPDALIAKIWSIRHPGRHLYMVKDEGLPETMPMVGVTIHGEEPDELVGVLLDLDGIRCSELLSGHDWKNTTFRV